MFEAGYSYFAPQPSRYPCRVRSRPHCLSKLFAHPLVRALAQLHVRPSVEYLPLLRALDLKVPTAESLSGGPWPDVLGAADGTGGRSLRWSMLCEVSSGTAPRASGTPLQGETVVGFSIVVTASMDLHTL